MSKFVYIGARGEHIVGIEPKDISAEEYDQLDYDHQQAVYLNKGSDGGALYQEVHEAPATPDVAPEPAPEPEPSQPLDVVPAEGAN